MSYEVDIDLEALPAGETVDEPAVLALCDRLLLARDVEDGAGLTLLFAGDDLLHRLNHEHRGVDAPTDVLSFPADEGEALPTLDATPGEAPPARYLGDIAISLPAVRRQATEAGLALDDELAHLVVHGVLHLLGHDHESDEDDEAMRALEESLLGPHIHAASPHEHE